MKKTSFFIFLSLSLLFSLCPGVSFAAVDKQKAFVSEVLSGDTLRLRGGKLLRYAGLQAPPLQHLLVDIRKYGEESKKFNESLVLNKEITVAWGPKIRDEQGNLVGYVFLADGTFVNMELVKAGHAKVSLTPPNVAYAADFRKAELAARRAKLGLWIKEPDNPFLKHEFLGEKNTKIYYLPTSPELERIPQANLVFFRSRVEATAAGYKACSTCKDGQQELY